MSLLYRPPGKKVADCSPRDLYTENLHRLRFKIKATATILAGGYNAHHKDWLQTKPPTDPPGRDTLALSMTHGLSQLVNGPTHIRGNRLDLQQFQKWYGYT